MSNRKLTEMSASKAFVEGAERRAKIAEWLSRNARLVRRTSAGFPILALPAMAAAQDAGGFVALDSIDGVASAQPLADGSYRITLQSGAEVTLAPADLRIVDGVLQVSAEAASVIAEVAAAGSLAGLGIAAGLGALGIGAAASGGGSDGGDDGEASATGGTSDGSGDGVPLATPSVALANDTGAANDDGITSDARLTLSAVPDGASREVFINGTSSGSSYVPPDEDGDYTVLVRDSSGGRSEEESVRFTLDTTAPVLEVALNDTGADDGDGVTFDPILVGLGEPEEGVTRSVTVNGEEQGVSYTPPEQAGDYTVVVTDTDLAGNVTTEEVSFTLIPLINLESELSSAATGFTAPEGTTELVVTFGEEEGATEFRAVLGEGGTWDLPLTPEERGALPQGEVTATLIARDQDGGEIASETQLVNIDTEAPQAPAIVELANDTGASDSDNLTSDPDLAISEPPDGAIREVRVNGELQGAEYTAPAEDGEYTVSVRNVDEAGNPSADTSVTFTLDTAPPATPTIEINDTGVDDAANVTTDANLTLSAAGTGVSRLVTLNGVDQGGSYTAPTEDGTYTVEVTDTDEAGNAASASLTFTLDRVAPEEPSAALASDTGANGGDGVTSDARLDISAVPDDATREVFVDEVSQGADYAAPTQDGDYSVRISHTDAAGNVSETTLSFTLDTTPPATPTIALTNDSGAAADDLLTNDASLTLSPADGVERSITVNGVAQGDTYTAPTDDAPYTVEVTDTDPAGNSATSSLTFTLDTTPPAAPSVDLADDTGPDDAANTTTDPNLVASAVPADATREVRVNGEVQGAAYTPPTEDGEYTVSFRDTDIAGNVSDATTVSFVLDTVAPTVTLDEISGGTLDLLDVQSDLEITGTAAGAGEGAQVDVVFDGQTYTGTTAQDDTFSVTVPQAVLQEIEQRPGDTATIDVSATATDLAGNVSEPLVTTVPADFTGPSIDIDPVTGDGIINATEAGETVTISGTTSNVPAGQTVTLSVNNVAVSGVTVQTGGIWSATIDTSDPAFGLTTDAATVAVTADVSDGAGLDAPQASATVTTDLTPPTLSVDIPLAGDGTINIAERDAGITVEGTTDAEDGQVVSLLVGGGGTPLTGVVEGGRFSIDVGSDVLGALTDGGTIDFDLSVEDVAGNEATDSATADTDFTPPIVEVTSPEGGDILNLADRENGGSVEGTTDAPDASTVTVSVLDSAGDPAFAPLTGIVTGGAFSVPVTPADVQALADGEDYTIEVTVEDAAGNPGTSGAFTVSTDFTAPTLTLDALSVGADLDAREQDEPLTVTGTSDAIGRTVTVTLDGTTAQGTVQPDGTWSAEFTPGQLDGLPDAASLTVSAAVENAAGNAATQDAPLATDFTPIVTLDPVARNGAFDLPDARANGLDVSGQAFGFAPPEEVLISFSGQEPDGTPLADNFTAPVGLDGTWSGNIPADFFSSFATAAELAISVRDTNSAARPATERAAGVAEPDYFLIQTDRQGDLVTFGVIESPSAPPSVGGDLQASFTINFDPSEASYVLDSEALLLTSSVEILQPSGQEAVDESADGEVTFGALAVNSVPEPGVPFATFQLQAASATQAFGVQITDDDGDYIWIETGGAGVEDIGVDDLSPQLTIIYGNGGDDLIDLSGAGPKVVVFNPDPAANGFDTVREFTTSDEAGSLADSILLQPDDPAALRGDGTGIEEVAAGGALGANTGFAVFTTELGSTAAADIETAVEGLVGEAAGDVFYVLASDGTDAVLAQVTFAGTDDASVARMALFEGEGDAASLGNDVIFPDASVVYNT